MKTNFLLRLAIIVFSMITASIFHLSPRSPAYAQIVMDGTMGTDGLIRGPNYDIKAGYGQQSGANLFHSFQTFNINKDESATFSGPNSIQNIISRVTGGNSSWIDGKLRSTIPDADLYLLNPAGIMFGANASLDIGGSFHVSTADYLRIGENERFYAMPMKNEVLSAASPIAFGFLDDTVSSVTFEKKQIESEIPSGLSVSEGKTISVIAGNIEMGGAYYQDKIDETNTEDVPLGTLFAPEGRIDIASIASKGEVIPTASGLDISSEKTGTISLDHALLSVSGEGAGSVFIRGGEFVADSSKVEADTTDKDAGVTDIRADRISIRRSDIFGNADGSGSGANITLAGAESVSISDLSRVFADAWESGDAGNVLIETKNLSVTTGGAISSDTYGTGKGGNITLRAWESVAISDPESKIFANAMGEDADAGDAGTILIQSPKFSLSNKGNISSDTYDGGGNGGQIKISGLDGSSADSVQVSDSQILSGTRWGKEADDGAGGIIEIIAKNISFTDGGRIRSESDGSGKGGDVILRASDSLLFSGVTYNAEGEKIPGKVYTSALSKEDYAGDAGNIFIEAGQIVFKDEGGVTASTEGPGNAGIIAIKADQVELDTGASISSASETEANGGSAGTITMDIGKILGLNNSSSITTETVGEGSAGDITLNIGTFSLNNGSSISSASSSLSDKAGDAGTITISSTGSIRLENNSAITTQAENAGKGKIFISVGGQYHMTDSKITTSIKKGGNDAGDIDISPPVWTIMNQSEIRANAWEGRGGNIHLIADHFVQSWGSVVDASSALGIDGSVVIESPSEDVSKGLIVLPSNLLDATRWLKTPCSARIAENVSRFVLTGRDATPNALDDWLPAPGLWFDDTDTQSDMSVERYRFSEK